MVKLVSPLSLRVLTLTLLLGSRVINEILRLVPNVDVFRDALRCIKLWAQRRQHCFRISLHCVLTLIFRSSYLFERKRFLRRCGMGHARRTDMPIIPECRCWRCCQSVLHHYAPLVGSLQHCSVSDFS